MIGTLIHNRYQIERELGRGGMGQVYKGYDIVLECDVAVKMIIKIEHWMDCASLLLDEGKTISQLNHPNIIRVQDVGEYFESPFIVMEYIKGHNLYQQPPKGIETIVSLMKQVCAALAYAHQHGIIHGDLKPENVILTEDGCAKLMDFGLSHSVSQLTQKGMIEGTIFYLAPEQAQRQNIDGRSDLYSLGVMLYELTTGELPFKADDPMEIICQHLHAPVVPPRVKNDQIPPALESLILGLLEKYPEDRPTSAIEVLERLSSPEVIDLDDERPQALSDLNRIVRGHIVGREQELRQTRQIWEQVTRGKGQLLLISGEPGIGKSRLIQEVVTQAQLSGGQAFIGENQPEGNTPYTAFSQIICQALRAPQNCGLELPNLVLAELVSIAPELRADYPDLARSPPLEPALEQRRFYECILRFFSRLCLEKPLLLVLEDIHWADSGTLMLLQMLAEQCREKAVLLLGTYREMELDEALPFYQTLVVLNTLKLGTRLKLERLDVENTCKMLEVLFSTEKITPEFLAGIYQETEGNPFFVEEVCKSLIETGQIYYDGRCWQRPPDMMEMAIPQSIKLTVQSRVNKLGSQAKSILLHAAVIGFGFDFEFLQKVCRLEKELLDEGLEAARRAGLIEEVRRCYTERYRFSHHLIPAALRVTFSGLRRTRLHRKVAQVMEKEQPDAYQRLAYHWGESGDEEKGLMYIIKAAEQAKATFANQDAIRWYDEALENLPEADKRRPDILSARANCYALIPAGNC